ncbi:OsmC family protein [Streptomyces sp. NPDC006012]|uniref:OsmC family protein n=1 Tax=Streptomyces sp. NPDC006012 TaxID=3364739 RepID=UPI00369AA586
MNTRPVSISEGRRLARSIAVGPHVLAADEPQPVRTDTGPTPAELLLAALGSCTSLAVRTFADRRGLPLDHVATADGRRALSRTASSGPRRRGGDGPHDRDEAPDVPRPGTASVTHVLVPGSGSSHEPGAACRTLKISERNTS